MKLYAKDSSGSYRIAQSDELIAAAQSVIRRRFRRGRVIRSPEDSVDLIRSEIGSLDHEVFAVMYLDNRHRLIKFDKVFRGTCDGTAVYPREIVKDALRHRSCALIACHNHPSAVVAPSAADERITRRLKAALELIDARLLDHIIVTPDDHVSLAARGLL